MWCRNAVGDGTDEGLRQAVEGSRREEEHPEVPQEDEPVETPGLDGDRPKRVSQLTAALKHNNGKHFRNQRF